MKSLICVILFFTLLIAEMQAQYSFHFEYALEKWTTTLSDGSNGTVNYIDAPHSVTIIGSDGAMRNNVDIDFTIRVTFAGMYSFDWEYFTNDIGSSPRYDVAGVLINGSFQQLSKNNSTAYQTGTFNSAYLAPGTIIGFRVRAIDNLFGNAIFNISNFSSPQIILPVNLTDFSGTRHNKAVKLTWKTSSETGTGFFEIEKSSDGRNFSFLHQTPWKGNTNLPQHYQIMDNHPFAGLNYYRLKQVDAGGAVRFSEVVKVAMENAKSIHLWPNPARDNIRITWSTSNTPDEIISLFDYTGKLLKRRTTGLSVTGNSSTDWDISRLQPGMYYFRLEKSEEILRFIKQP